MISRLKVPNYLTPEDRKKMFCPFLFPSPFNFDNPPFKICKLYNKYLELCKNLKKSILFFVWVFHRILDKKNGAGFLSGFSPFTE